MSKFNFVEDKILEENLNITFRHVLDLVPLLDDSKYNKVSKSSFRKTIIIHTASIIEALLFYVLVSNFDEKDLEIKTWKLKNKKELHKVNDEHRIISGDYKVVVEKIKLNKLNLGSLSIFLKDKGFVNNSLHAKIDKVRKLRNEQHLGTHIKIKDYSKKDIEFVFSVAKDVKDLSK